MIKGLNKFREHFKDFNDQYVLIGGVASETVMNNVGLDFRATKDFDIVLCVEALDVLFAKTFWLFIEEGGYQNRQKSSGGKIFYRFQSPKNTSYPVMLELFSRKLDGIELLDNSTLTPVPIDEDVSSLSAILLDTNYYNLLQQYKVIIDGISVVKEECLIPFKAKAWLDLKSRKAAGENIPSAMIKKHKNDIFRLFQLLSPEQKVELPDTIKKDMGQFLNELGVEPSISLKPFGLGNLSTTDVIDALKKIYIRE